MILVLDTSALLSGRFTSLPSSADKVLITPEVKGEVSKGAPARNLENLLECGLQVRAPVSDERAIKAAEETGDLGALSKADISVIALALEVEEPLVMTDDFRVQNVLSALDVRFESSGEIGDKRIRSMWKWMFRCRGCGRYFDEEPGPDCPICGSDLKRVKKN